MAARKPARGKKVATPRVVYQFKLTLRNTQPPIWRRIQVPECTLDDLHGYIQTAMGWTNSHLHSFHVGEQLYGDPDLLCEMMEEYAGRDSLETRLCDLIPEGTDSLALEYQYDFGDGWDHDVEFEGRQPFDAAVGAPVCLDGARACPPEDCGGAWGYQELLQILANKKHPERREKLSWLGGKFDPEAFTPAAATKAMRQGLPRW
jgi:hypothetical protein